MIGEGPGSTLGTSPAPAGSLALAASLADYFDATGGRGSGTRLLTAGTVRR